MGKDDFYNWFETIASRLQVRRDSFYKIFKYKNIRLGLDLDMLKFEIFHNMKC